MKNDRTMIAPLLLPFYPAMANASSDEWQVLLNSETGLDISRETENATAFDQWRMALAANKGLPVWGVTQADIDETKRRLAVLLEREAVRNANEEALLARLRIEAPGEAVQR